jgi:hypothetical protein
MVRNRAVKMGRLEKSEFFLGLSLKILPRIFSGFLARFDKAHENIGQPEKPMGSSNKLYYNIKNRNCNVSNIKMNAYGN